MTRIVCLACFLCCLSTSHLVAKQLVDDRAFQTAAELVAIDKAPDVELLSKWQLALSAVLPPQHLVDERTSIDGQLDGWWPRDEEGRHRRQQLQHRRQEISDATIEWLRGRWQRTARLSKLAPEKLRKELETLYLERKAGNVSPPAYDYLKPFVLAGDLARLGSDLAVEAHHELILHHPADRTDVQTAIRYFTRLDRANEGAAVALLDILDRIEIDSVTGKIIVVSRPEAGSEEAGAVQIYRNDLIEIVAKLHSWIGNCSEKTNRRFVVHLKILIRSADPFTAGRAITVLLETSEPASKDYRFALAAGTELVAKLGTEYDALRTMQLNQVAPAMSNAQWSRILVEPDPPGGDLPKLKGRAAAIIVKTGGNSALIAPLAIALAQTTKSRNLLADLRSHEGVFVDLFIALALSLRQHHGANLPTSLASARLVGSSGDDALPTAEHVVQTAASVLANSFEIFLDSVSAIEELRSETYVADLDNKAKVAIHAMVGAIADPELGSQPVRYLPSNFVTALKEKANHGDASGHQTNRHMKVREWINLALGKLEVVPPSGRTNHMFVGADHIEDYLNDQIWVGGQAVDIPSVGGEFAARSEPSIFYDLSHVQAATKAGKDRYQAPQKTLWYLGLATLSQAATTAFSYLSTDILPPEDTRKFHLPPRMLVAGCPEFPENFGKGVVYNSNDLPVCLGGDAYRLFMDGIRLTEEKWRLGTNRSEEEARRWIRKLLAEFVDTLEKLVAIELINFDSSMSAGEIAERLWEAVDTSDQPEVIDLFVELYTIDLFGLDYLEETWTIIVPAYFSLRAGERNVDALYSKTHDPLEVILTERMREKIAAWHSYFVEFYQLGSVKQLLRKVGNKQEFLPLLALEPESRAALGHYGRLLSAYQDRVGQDNAVFNLITAGSEIGFFFIPVIGQGSALLRGLRWGVKGVRHGAQAVQAARRARNAMRLTTLLRSARLGVFTEKILHVTYLHVSLSRARMAAVFGSALIVAQTLLETQSILDESEQFFEIALDGNIHWRRQRSGSSDPQYFAITPAERDGIRRDCAEQRSSSYWTGAAMTLNPLYARRCWDGAAAAISSVQVGALAKTAAMAKGFGPVGLGMLEAGAEQLLFWINKERHARQIDALLDTFYGTPGAEWLRIIDEETSSGMDRGELLSRAILRRSKL